MAIREGISRNWRDVVRVISRTTFKSRAVLAFLAVACLLANSAQSQERDLDSLSSYRGYLFDVPVYDPYSKSYFELGNNPAGGGSRVAGWPTADRIARSKSYKGVRGRLAIIRSREANDFILKTFKPPNETYFGLRMACSEGFKLIWVDGKILSRKDYQNWGRMWHYPYRYLPCTGTGANAKYGGVVYNRLEGRPRWYVIAPLHATVAFLVEYPTGKE